jgi:DNA repair exonuclease SbcCD nuclease subunit
MTRILVTSDWHLDVRFDGVPRWPEFQRFVSWLESLIGNEGIDYLLVGGDYFDPGNTTDLMNASRLVSVARRLHRACRGGSVWIAGNHDVVNHASGTTALSPLREAGIEGLVTVERQDRNSFLGLGTSPHAVLAIPYTSSVLSDHDLPWDDVETWLDQNTGSVIVISHLDVPGAMMGTESREMARGRPHQIPVDRIKALGHQDRVIAINGHYHKPQTICAGIDVHIPGSPLRLDFGERSDGCGAMIIEIDD